MDPRISDLIAHAMDKKPSEFQDTFNDIVTDRLAQAVADRKVELAKDIFNDVPDTPGEKEPNDKDA